MALTNAEKQARWRARRAKRIAELEAKAIEPSLAERITAQIEALQAEAAKLKIEVADLRACINPAKRKAIFKKSPKR